ncbi:MAG: NYN domain-containing protein [Oscillospiraceae bacterium]
MSDKKYAVLIDAENVSDKYIKAILDEISNEGTITYKRIYGDWTRPGLSSWKNILLNHSITPIQQYGYTTGKSSTDSAMIIDAMDILYSGSVDGFCIVSSDSDFTRLAVRLRESGMNVIGMGEKKTPKAFIAACNIFKHLEIIGDSDKVESRENESGASDDLTIANIKRAVAEIVSDVSDESGCAALSDVGNILIKRFPSFDVRHFGYKKLTPFIKSLGLYDIISVPNQLNPNVKVVLIKEKN